MMERTAAGKFEHELIRTFLLWTRSNKHLQGQGILDHLFFVHWSPSEPDLAEVTVDFDKFHLDYRRKFIDDNPASYADKMMVKLTEAVSVVMAGNPAPLIIRYIFRHGKGVKVVRTAVYSFGVQIH